MKSGIIITEKLNKLFFNYLSTASVITGLVSGIAAIYLFLGRLEASPLSVAATLAGFMIAIATAVSAERLLQRATSRLNSIYCGTQWQTLSGRIGTVYHVRDFGAEFVLSYANGTRSREYPSDLQTTATSHHLVTNLHAGNLPRLDFINFISEKTKATRVHMWAVAFAWALLSVSWISLGGGHENDPAKAMCAIMMLGLMVTFTSFLTGNAVRRDLMRNLKAI